VKFLVPSRIAICLLGALAVFTASYLILSKRHVVRELDVPLNDIVFAISNDVLFAKIHIPPSLMQPESRIARFAGTRAIVVHHQRGSLRGTKTNGIPYTTWIDTVSRGGRLPLSGDDRGEPPRIVVPIPSGAKTAQVTVIDSCDEEIDAFGASFSGAKVCVMRYETAELAVSEIYEATTRSGRSASGQ
jgi:hypothetical protein